jgi:putative ABC transport system substrate-binding protein
VVEALLARVISERRRVPRKDASLPGLLARRSLLCALIAAVFTTSTPSWCGSADSQALAVIYPDVEEPYRSIFLQIIDGVKEKSKSEVVLYRMKAEVDAGSMNVWLREHAVKRAILLGRQGVKLAPLVDAGVRRIAGGAMLSPGTEAPTFAGISLAPDPEQLLALLKELAPAVKRVIVIFNPMQNRWLIEIARESAKRQGVELIEREARDLRAAAVEYREVLSKADSRRDALWLPQDSSTIDDELILPLILREAWDRKLVVFSSNLAHAKKGVLFALYPDNRGWGRELADLAYGAGAASIFPLKTLRSAINLRTASHLGVEVAASKFDAAFPEP